MDEYLRSPQALHSLKTDLYWPKWDSPWWHMLLLHEMGETRAIPGAAIEEVVRGLADCPLKIFPVLPEDLTPDVDPRHTHCHCALGSVYQVLAAWGVDVDCEIPWIRPWFLRYQMADGGLNCDENAYRVSDECPSSMVATIAPFEAILRYTPRPWNEAEIQFLRRGADFLIGRRLVQGSQTRHNAEERASQEKWAKLCFPRFYFYDHLRGLDALTLWAEKTGIALPAEVTQPVVECITARFPEGDVRTERLSYEGVGTLIRDEKGQWKRRPEATLFPLLEKVSAVGQVSTYLTRQWRECQGRTSPE